MLPCTCTTKRKNVCRHPDRSSRMVSATIAYTAVPEGKARAGIVIGGAAANGVFPLNPSTWLSGNTSFAEVVIESEVWS